MYAVPQELAAPILAPTEGDIILIESLGEVSRVAQWNYADCVFPSSPRQFYVTDSEGRKWWVTKAEELADLTIWVTNPYTL